MHIKGRFHNTIFGPSLTPLSAALAIMLMLLFLILLLVLMNVTAQPVQGQTYTVIYSFTGGIDGSGPVAGLTMDPAGNLYGPNVAGGGPQNAGTVFELSKKGSGWILMPLYSFAGGADGAAPEARVMFGPGGILFGTTASGGSTNCPYYGCGTIFSLRPPATACRTALCSWDGSLLYRFQGGTDGQFPIGDLAFDQEGNIYGATNRGGEGNCGGYTCGVVYQLMPSKEGWTETVLYRFTGGMDGGSPSGGLVFDTSGNLYGTTYTGGEYGYGTIFQLTPSGSGWTENVLYSFNGVSDGGTPVGGVVPDASGNLYGITYGYGPGPTVVFMLSPSYDGWTFGVLYDGCGYCGPGGTLNIDATGNNLYGTMYRGGAYYSGNVFKLSRSGGWAYTNLYSFTGGSDGGWPQGTVVVDKDGNVYGTTPQGGAYGGGLIFEITP